ncbi:hypothetical protein B0H19DRAFT_1185846 [Mycena capillaripes]|nr:hypothetical protein B0H19DRAFT_1185846 [Mycena capillaripes]
MASRQQTSASTSPRRTFSDRISAVGAKINRALSSDAGRPGQNGYDPETQSITSTIVEGTDRSSSRGRNFHSSGRGGAGNIYSTANSNTVSAPPGEVPQEFPWPRGRERAPVERATPTPAASGVRSTGRGGSGNFSQPPAADPSYSLRDREILRAHAEADKNAVRSSGRGGIGNIVTPVAPDAAARSRSRSVDPLTSPPGYSTSPSRGAGNGNVNGHGYGVNGVHGT